MISRVLAGLIVASMIAVSAPAPLAAAGVEVIPYAGYRAGGDFDSLLSGIPDVELDESAHYGLAIEIPVGRPGLRLQLLYSHQRTDLDLDRVFSSPTLLEVEIDHAHAGFVYEWERGNLRPYFVGSAGISQLDPRDVRLESFSRGSLSLGGGAKFMLNRRFGFRLEGRLYGIHTQGDEVLCDFDGCAFESPNPFLWQFEGSAGLVFSF